LVKATTFEFIKFGNDEVYYGDNIRCQVGNFLSIKVQKNFTPHIQKDAFSLFYKFTLNTEKYLLKNIFLSKNNFFRIDNISLVDDLLIFAEANMGSILAVKEVLAEFESISSLKANPAKSFFLLYWGI
jgi:hypothetical protein